MQAVMEDGVSSGDGIQSESGRAVKEGERGSEKALAGF